LGFFAGSESFAATGSGDVASDGLLAAGGKDGDGEMTGGFEAAGVATEETGGPTTG